MIVRIHTQNGEKTDKWVLIELQGHIKIKEKGQVRSIVLKNSHSKILHSY